MTRPQFFARELEVWPGESGWLSAAVAACFQEVQIFFGITSVVMLGALHQLEVPIFWQFII